MNTDLPDVNEFLKTKWLNIDRTSKPPHWLWTGATNVSGPRQAARPKRLNQPTKMYSYVKLITPKARFGNKHVNPARILFEIHNNTHLARGVCIVHNDICNERMCVHPLHHRLKSPAKPDIYAYNPIVEYID